MQLERDLRISVLNYYISLRYCMVNMVPLFLPISLQVNTCSFFAAEVPVF